jgi:hypothetical protein
MKNPIRPVKLIPKPKPRKTVALQHGWLFDCVFCIDVAKACQDLDSCYAPSAEGVELVLRVLEKRGYIIVP